MGLFRIQKRKPSYSVFRGYSYYLPGIKGMLMMLALFFAGALVGNFVVLGLTAVSAEFSRDYGMLISYPVMFIPPMLYASAVSRRNEIFEVGYALDSSNFGDFSGIFTAFTVSVATVAVAFLAEPVTSLLPEMPAWLKEVMDQMLDGGPLWVTVLSVSVFAPVFEEWLCRGIVLRGLLKHMGPAAAIVISAVFFGVLHMNPWQAIPAFCLGALFGYVYYRTGSLKLTMLMHCVNNTMSVIFSQIPAFKDAETFMEVMSPWAYAVTYAACVLILGSAVILLRGIPKKEDALGGCDRIAPVSVE